MFICIESPISFLPELDKKSVNYPNRRLKMELSEKLRLFSLSSASFTFDSAFMSFLVNVESII